MHSMPEHSIATFRNGLRKAGIDPEKLEKNTPGTLEAYKLHCKLQAHSRGVNVDVLIQELAQEMRDQGKDVFLD